MTADGAPVVAWQQDVNGGARSLHVARWQKSGWEVLGNPVDDSGRDAYSLAPSLWLDTTGRSWVAWTSGASGQSWLRVARWNGKSWERVYDLALPKDRQAHSARLSSSGRLGPTLAWLEVTGQKRVIHVLQWQSDRFKPIPAPPTLVDGGGPSSVLLTSMPSGGLVLAWEEVDASQVTRLHAELLGGRGWSSLFSGLHLDSVTVEARSPTLATVSDAIVIAWDEPGRSSERLRTAHFFPCKASEVPAPFAKSIPLAEMWPRTVEAAAEQILAELAPDAKKRIRATPRSELLVFHHGWGTGIRNQFGLWGGNTSLLGSCGGGKAVHPDTCSARIIERVWEKLQRSPADDDR